jgi:nucleoside-diphosphate kinase
VYENVIHVSANAEEAEREIKLWFAPEEIIVNLYPTKEVLEKEKKIKIWA